MAALPFRLPDEEGIVVPGAGAGADTGGGVEGPGPAVGDDALGAPVLSSLTLPERELTPRALAAGCAVGVVLAAGNVYTGLKLGFIDAGALTATLVTFTMFAALRRFGPRAFTPLENNVAQTVAASAACHATPSLSMPGEAPPSLPAPQPSKRRDVSKLPGKFNPPINHPIMASRLSSGRVKSRFSDVGAVYDRPYFVDSRKCGRS